ncbi:MAG: glycosyltransferase family protein [Planctomycetota bacterium]
MIGSRDMPDSVVGPHQPWYRRWLGKVLRFLRKRIMLKDINDTQCGFKLFTRRTGKRVFGELVTNGFAFDCEALLLARKLGYRIKEVGVIWCNDVDSRVRLFRDSIGMFLSLIGIRWRLRGVHAPAPAPAPLPTAAPPEPEPAEAEAEP